MTVSKTQMSPYMVKNVENGILAQHLEIFAEISHTPTCDHLKVYGVAKENRDWQCTNSWSHLFTQTLGNIRWRAGPAGEVQLNSKQWLFSCLVVRIDANSIALPVRSDLSTTVRTGSGFMVSTNPLKWKPQLVREIVPFQKTGMKLQLKQIHIIETSFCFIEHNQPEWPQGKRAQNIPTVTTKNTNFVLHWQLGL